MAKLSAHDNEVARATKTIQSSTDESTNWSRTEYVFMSDGVILKKHTVQFKGHSDMSGYMGSPYIHSYGWKRYGKYKLEQLQEYLEKLVGMGFTVEGTYRSGNVLANPQDEPDGLQPGVDVCTQCGRDITPEESEKNGGTCLKCIAVPNPPSCHTCGTTENLERQIGGFWFCFDDLPAAVQKGASYWIRLYRAMYPWRFEDNPRLPSLDNKTKNMLNHFLHELGKKYHDGIPLQEIRFMLNLNNIKILDEDGAEWYGMILGEQGHATWQLGQNGAATNKYLFMSWYKMPSGRYEIVAYVS
jgi:hypothetical protein